jgi:hypothetical protein
MPAHEPETGLELPTASRRVMRSAIGPGHGPCAFSVCPPFTCRLAATAAENPDERIPERDERHLARMRKKALIDERIANSPTNAACCWC